MSLPMHPDELIKKDDRFEYATGDGKAFLEYRKKGDTYIITHTEVPPSRQGEGVASSLVSAVLTHIREDGGKVRPLCPYVEQYIERHEEWQSVLE